MQSLKSRAPILFSFTHAVTQVKGTAKVETKVVSLLDTNICNTVKQRSSPWLSVCLMMTECINLFSNSIV